MLRALIVEDEPLIAMLLADMLQGFGCEIIGPAHNFHVALSYATEAAFDVALLDVNLKGQRSYAIADIIRGRGITHLFITGYGSDLNPRYAYTPTLVKPIDPADLRKTLASITSSRA